MQEVIQYIKKELSPMYPQTEIRSFIQLILAHQFKMPLHQLLNCKGTKIARNDRMAIENMVSQLQQFVPIQQILGETEFYGLRLLINQHVLIPRPETEEMVERIVRTHQRKGLEIWDIGTGSGCMAIALAKSMNEAVVFASDISVDALSLAKRNAELHQVDICWMEHDILSPIPSEIPEHLDIMVCNPPYVTPDEKTEMSLQVLNYEPHLALFTPDHDPFLFYRRLADIGVTHLKSDGSLYVEINRMYGKEITELFKKKGYRLIQLFQDNFGNDRIIHAQCR